MKRFLQIPCFLLLMMSGCFACQDQTDLPVQKDEITVVTETTAAESDANTDPKTESAEKKQKTTVSSARTGSDADKYSVAPFPSDDSTDPPTITTNAAGEILLPELP